MASRTIGRPAFLNVARLSYVRQATLLCLAGIAAAGFVALRRPVPAEVMVRGNASAAHVTPQAIPGIHNLLTAMGARPDVRRNPFAFRAARRSERRSATASATSLPSDDVAPSSSDPARLRLIGIAEATEDLDPVRTAIISAAGALYLVKEGDVTSRYRVARILATTAELIDVGDGTIRHLALQ